MGNYKTPASASASWAVVRKKLLANNAAAAPQTPKKGKAAAETSNGDVVDDDDEGGCKFTPINAPRKNKRDVKDEKPFDLKIEADENDEVTPAALSDFVTPKKAGKTHVKPEPSEGGEAGPVLSTPSKKRVRKAKDDTDTSSKRTRTAVTETAATASVTPVSDGIALPTTNIPMEGNNSHSLLQVDTPSQEAYNVQGI